jgi:hypothetical protein
MKKLREHTFSSACLTISELKVLNIEICIHITVPVIFVYLSLMKEHRIGALGEGM